MSNNRPLKLIFLPGTDGTGELFHNFVIELYIIRSILNTAASQCFKNRHCKSFAINIRKRLTSALNVDYSNKLVSIKVPILYLPATEDRVVPKKATEIITHLKPDVEVVEIDGPHFLLQASPKESATAVNRFLSRVQASL